MKEINVGTRKLNTKNYSKCRRYESDISRITDVSLVAHLCVKRMKGTPIALIVEIGKLEHGKNVNL